MKLFKKRDKKKPQKDFIYQELDVDEELRKHRRTNTEDESFKTIENLQYVRTQCDQIAESTNYINDLKKEYQVVNNYLNDIQVIEETEKGILNNLKNTAMEAIRLEKQRQIIREGKSLISQDMYSMFQRFEEEFPQALYDFQNEEKYSNAVKHDMKVLEAEKMSLKEDIENYSMRRTNTRNIAIISLLGIIAVFVVFFMSGSVGQEEGVPAFMVILLLVAIYVALLFVLFRRTVYNMKMAEKKLSRAVMLLNKTKIKYVNVYGSLEYKRLKYKSKNFYELSKNYQNYLEEHKRTERYKSSAVELDDAINRMNAILKGLNLYDYSIWEKQIDALADEKEMVEIRHSLNSRRQKLRERIDYNMGRVEEARQGIVNFTKNNSGIYKEIMEIVDSYDMDF